MLVADVRGRGVLPEQQVAALGGDPADRALAAGSHPDRRVRPLRGRRLDHDIVELPISAAMRERLVGGPGFEDHGEAFVVARIGLVHRYAEAGELVVAIALADAEIEPPAGEEVEGRRLLGQQDRVVPRQHHDRGAEPQPAGARAEPGQEVDRRRDLAIAGEMVLDDKGAVKAERLGLDIVFDEIAKALGAVELGLFGPLGAPRRRTAEQAELHRLTLVAKPLLGWTLRQRQQCSKCRLPIAGIANRHGLSKWPRCTLLPSPPF